MARTKEPYPAIPLPEAYGEIDYHMIMDDLIDATAALEAYKMEVHDIKVDLLWYMPNLQRKETLKSSMMEGTRATQDEVLIHQTNPDKNDQDLNDVDNYCHAFKLGYKMLMRSDFDDEFFFDIHKALLSGKVRKNVSEIGKYRSAQNYVVRGTGNVIYTPTAAENVPVLMKNLIDFMNASDKSLRPLMQTAVIHAQFETIHPFLDGNGRVGRILIPLFLFAKGEPGSPNFFLSEALEKDKMNQAFSILYLSVTCQKSLFYAVCERYNISVF